MYDTIRQAPPEEPFPIVCSRGFGKTFIGSVVANELARQASNANILILSSTLKKLRTIVRPAFDTVLEDCPEDFLPKYNTQDSVFEYPTGVNVHLCAAEKGHIKDLRGIHNVILVLIDEAAFFGDEDSSYPLDYVVEHILNPMFLRSKMKARTIMLTTPPDTPNHPFKAYYDIAKQRNCTATFDIYQSDIPLDKIEEMKRRCKDPLAWRREYLCEWVIDESRMIIPEWLASQPASGPHPYVAEYDETDPLFQFWDKYFSLDTGTIDKTVGHLSFYNFSTATIHFADEITRQGREWTTDDLAKEIRAKEELRWGSNAKVYRRTGDNDNQILLSDMTTLHKLPINPTTKDTLQAMVNVARMWVNSGRVKVHPRCKLLIQTLRDGIWNAKKNEFARTGALGHMDALASFIYCIRNIDTAHNPVPLTHGFDPATQYWLNDPKPQSTQAMERAITSSNPFLNGGLE